MRSKLVTAPATEPVSLAELKLFLRIDTSDEDALLTSLIVSARQTLEKISNHSFITQTQRLVLDRMPLGSSNSEWWDGTREGAISQLYESPLFIQLPLGPVQSITSFKYFDTDNSEQTYSADNYYLDDSGDLARLVKNDTAQWPVNLRTYSSINIDYVTGYGVASAVPENIKSAVKLLASHYYENRGECSDQEIPSSILTMIDCLSLRRLG